MNLDDVMRELGLDMFTSSSSRQGTEDDEFDEVEAPPGDIEDDPTALDDLEPGEEPDREFEDEPPLETQDEGDGEEPNEEVINRLEDISHEIDQLASQVEDNQSSVEAMRDEREELMDRLDNIEENNATLLGVYDRLTNDINPFAADWDERYDQKVSEQDEQTFGVIEPPENEAEARAAAMSETEPEPEDTGGLSFDDLKDKHESEDEPEDDADDEPEEDRPSHEGPSHEEVTPAEPPDPKAVSVNGDVTPAVGPGGNGDAYLDTLAPTYASEVVMLEWLSMLIEIAGPAGAMKALDFYERIDWISPTIKRQLEDLLSGAHTDDLEETPARPPSDLTAEEHNQSFAHIMRLAQQSRLARAKEG